MSVLFTIGEISKILDIPTSTLRFWERKGLFKVKKQENNYRCYSERDALHIADIAFLRSLGIPIHDVSRVEMHPLESYRDYLESIELDLTAQIAEIQRNYNRISKQIQVLDRVYKLMEYDYEIVDDVPFSAIVHFTCSHKTKLRQYMSDPSQYIWHVHTHEESEGRRCIIADPDTAVEPLIWQKKEGHRYAHFLVRSVVDNDFQDDMNKTVQLLQQTYETGAALLQALIFATENEEFYWYLEAYVEIYPISHNQSSD